VVTNLKLIENKIGHIIATFGAQPPTGQLPDIAEPVGEEALLNGPQLPTVAMDQSDIDKLLASFD